MEYFTCIFFVLFLLCLHLFLLRNESQNDSDEMRKIFFALFTFISSEE